MHASVCNRASGRPQLSAEMETARIEDVMTCDLGFVGSYAPLHDATLSRQEVIGRCGALSRLHMVCLVRFQRFGLRVGQVATPSTQPRDIGPLQIRARPNAVVLTARTHTEIPYSASGCWSGTSAIVPLTP